MDQFAEWIAWQRELPDSFLDPRFSFAFPPAVASIPLPTCASRILPDTATELPLSPNATEEQRAREKRVVNPSDSLDCHRMSIY